MWETRPVRERQMKNYVVAAKAMAFCAGGAKAKTRVRTAAPKGTRALIHCHMTETVASKSCNTL